MKDRRGFGKAALAVLPLLVLAGGLLGCQKREAMEVEEAPSGPSSIPPQAVGGNAKSLESAAPASPAAADAAGTAAAPVPALRKLIRRVELDLAVRDTEGAAQAAQQLAQRVQGYLESMDSRRSGELMYYEVTLRIPSPRLDEVLAALKKGADRIDREQQGVEDVTSQYVDLTARMKTLKGTEAELQALLAESRSRGRKAGEIMEIFRELTGIRTQIEQIEAQVRTFDQLAALSTLHLKLAPTEAAKPVAEPGWKPWQTVRSAFRSLVSLLRGGVDLLIILVIDVLPVLLVLWLAWLGVKRVRSALRRRREGR